MLQQSSQQPEEAAGHGMVEDEVVVQVEKVVQELMAVAGSWHILMLLTSWQLLPCDMGWKKTTA